MRTYLVCLMLAVTTFAACSAADTTVRLAVTYDPAWQLETFELTAGGVLDRGPAATEVRVLVPDHWGGQPVMIELDGRHGGTRVAHGVVEIMPIAGSEVH